MTPGLASYYKSLQTEDGKKLAILATELDDKAERNYMQFFNCNPEWPICLYDFSFKSKCPTYFAFRVGKPLQTFVIDDYFYGKDFESIKTGKAEFAVTQSID